MKLKKGQKIYGWHNIDINNDGGEILESEIIDTKNFRVVDKITGEVAYINVRYLAYNKPRWFITYNEAKKAFLNIMMEEIQFRQEIVNKLVKDAREVKKGNIVAFDDDYFNKV